MENRKNEDWVWVQNLEPGKQNDGNKTVRQITVNLGLVHIMRVYPIGEASFKIASIKVVYPPRGNGGLLLCIYIFYQAERRH